jgi:hypothetical protein
LRLPFYGFPAIWEKGRRKGSKKELKRGYCERTSLRTGQKGKRTAKKDAEEELEKAYCEQPYS